MRTLTEAKVKALALQAAITVCKPSFEVSYDEMYPSLNERLCNLELARLVQEAIRKEQTEELEAERGDSQFCAGCNEAAKTIEKQLAALKLAKRSLDEIDYEIRLGGYADGFSEIWKRLDEALAAIDEVLGE